MTTATVQKKGTQFGDASGSIVSSDRMYGIANGLTKMMSPIQIGDFLRANYTFTAKLVGDVTNPAFAGGADPTGVADSTAAIKACRDYLFAHGGGEMYFPVGRFKVTDTIEHPTQSLALETISIRGEGGQASRLVANTSAMFTKPVLFWHNIAGGGFHIRDIGIDGPTSENAFSNGNGSNGIIIANAGASIIDGVDGFGCVFGINLTFSDAVLVQHCHWREAQQSNLVIGNQGSGRAGGITVIDSLFQVGDPSGNSISEPSNIMIDGAQNVGLYNLTVDELGLNKAIGGASIMIGRFLTTQDVHVDRVRVFAAGSPTTNPYYGIHVGPAAVRTTLSNILVEPYSHDVARIPTNTIRIDSGAQDTVLENVTTTVNSTAADPTSMGTKDISDLGTRSIWRNVNGRNKEAINNATFASSFTPVRKDGSTVRLTLTGNVTINGPVNPTTGDTMKYFLIQDTTGGRTVTWSSSFLIVWSDSGNTASTHSNVTVEYNGTKWEQVGNQRAWL